jgi:type II secretory ATPase GspE/PulE/Tfp pilus assembly ATPase PilB-like protein
LLEPLADRQMHQSAADWYYSLPQSILEQLGGLDKEELKVLQNVMRKKGISLVDGGYQSGKTAIAVALIKALFLTSAHVK